MKDRLLTILEDFYDRIIKQKTSTILGVFLVLLGIYFLNKSHDTALVLLTLGASLVTTRDTFFKTGTNYRKK